MDDKPMFYVMSLKHDMAPPPFTDAEQWRMRVFLALAHEDGKCHIYGDDGGLQCSNWHRHGRMLDFRREPISDLLDVVEWTRLKEYAESQAKPTEGTST